MNLIIVSPFWNSSELTKKCIESLKSQYYTNFKAYFIDDVSTDNSYDVAKETIGDDDRFILIKNTVKKHKTNNFIDIIRDNNDIRWDDVIIELDGDDRLSDNFVLGRINKVFMDENIWVCGSKWKDQHGRLGNYGKPKPHRARKTSWNFSHLRTFRSFLFNLIDDDDLKFEGSYFKAACDLGHGIPILEMCGDEHFHYIDEPLYTYIWHDRQSYSDKTDFKDKSLQGRTAKHIYGLKSYLPVKLSDSLNSQNTRKKVMSIDSIPKDFNSNNNEVVKGILKEFNPRQTIKTVDYDEVNKVLGKPSVPQKINEDVSTIEQHKPTNRNELIDLKRKMIINGVNPGERDKPTNFNRIKENIGDKKIYVPKNGVVSIRVTPKGDKPIIKKNSIAELANKIGFGDGKNKKK